MPIQGRLDNPGDIDLISYQLDAGKSYGIAASGFNLDLVLTIEDQTGRVVATADGAPGSDDPIISFTPEVSGQYNLLIAAKPSEATGDVFTLYVQDRSSIKPFSRPNTAIIDDITGIEDRETKFSLFNALRDDSKLNKTELQEILLSAGDQGVVTEQEFRDLGVLSHNLSNHLEGPGADYLKYIFDSVVLGSAANAKWTGGELKSVDLGNLQAGSSAQHLNRLVDKWFLGKDLPVPRVPGDKARNESDITNAPYASASGALFDESITYTDVNQGKLSSCWFLAAAASLAAWKPEEIRSIFIDNNDETFGIRFYELLGTNKDSQSSPAHWVTVNRQLLLNPNNTAKLLNAAGTPDKSPTGELWPALLEKGAAQASELGIFKAYRDITLNSFESINVGKDEGSAMLSRATLSRAGTFSETTPGVEGTNYFAINSLDQFLEFSNRYSKSITSGNGPGTLLSNVSLSRDFEPTTAWPRTFVKAHIYAIVGFNAQNITYTLYNPWGSGPSNYQRDAWSPFQISASDLYDKYLLPSIGSANTNSPEWLSYNS